MWHQLERLITKYGDKDDQVAKDLVALLKEHQDSLDIIPGEELSYEELMTYHLAFEPFFPDQRDFETDDDLYTTYHDDLRKLKETDFMGPRTRAMYNKRKALKGKVVPPTAAQQRKLDGEEEGKFDFSKLDQLLYQRRLDQMKNMGGMFGL